MAEKELILILGGARSGKSEYAQQLAGQLGHRVLYVATATAGDEEMEARIAVHRASRPPHWRTLEAPTGVGEALEEAIGDAEVVVLDCLTLLVSNLMTGEPEQEALEKQVLAELKALLEVYAAHEATFIVVSNEVGMGIVPAYPMGRVYRDVLGRANQWLAARADKVILLIAGLPIELKALVVKSAQPSD